MVESRAVLVVDDEEVIAHACRRIFTRQGFQVDANTDARQGLAMALEKDYEIILLDIKMPNMDGIQFLEELRRNRSETPVLIITGYPSIPNAAAAMRLGACDYVTKPFTPEEITSAVQRVLATRRLPDTQDEASEAVEAMFTAESLMLFWGESWFRMEVDGSACVGAVLPGLGAGKPVKVTLPRIGEVVYQGLPMAAVHPAGQRSILVAAPVSGVIMAINDALPKHLEWLSKDPCGSGWIAHICTTEYDREADQCGPRRVLLVNADPVSAEDQRKQLALLGCEVQVVADRAALEAALADTENRVAILDATSLGEVGPQLVGVVNQHAPRLRIVVAAAAGVTLETAYRKHKILYYAVEPFSDSEMADILSAAFQPHESTAPERAQGESEPISSVSITNRSGHHVQLLAAPGLLWRNEGLGRCLGHRLLAQMLPVVMTPGVANLSPSNVLKAATTHDRLMVLLAKDSGLLPGSLARDTKPDFGVDPGDAAGKVTTLSVQPDEMGGLAGLDARTTCSLADHIMREMMAC